MRILFTDVLKTASSITSPNESANYPASNLIHQFARVRYQHTHGTADTVTFNFASAVSVNSLFFTYTNATGLQAKLYNGVTLLETVTFTMGKQTGRAYCTETRSVTKIELIVTGATAYLGAFAGGVYFALPDPVSSWEESFLDGSVWESSPDGQTTQNPAVPLAVKSFQFREFDRAGVDLVTTEYSAAGLGKPIWIDPFHSNSTYMTPFYGKITAYGPVVKNGRRFDLSITFCEAR